MGWRCIFCKCVGFVEVEVGFWEVFGSKCGGIGSGSGGLMWVCIMKGSEKSRARMFYLSFDGRRVSLSLKVREVPGSVCQDLGNVG